MSHKLYTILHKLYTMSHKLYTMSHKLYTMSHKNIIFKTFRWTVFRVTNIHYVNKKINILYNIYDKDTSKDNRCDFLPAIDTCKPLPLPMLGVL